MDTRVYPQGSGTVKGRYVNGVLTFFNKAGEEIYSINPTTREVSYAGPNAGLRVAKAEFDTAVLANRPVAVHGLGVTIPSGAVVVGGFMQVNTGFTSASTNTGQIAIHVQGANDIVSAAAVSGAPYSTTGLKAIVPKANTPESTGIAITADREVTATVTVAALTAGKLTVFIYYVK